MECIPEIFKGVFTGGKLTHIAVTVARVASLGSKIGVARGEGAE